MDIYSERIKPLFAESKLPDTQLEQEIGLPRSIIYKWDNGVSSSYKSYVDKIAEYFDVSTDYLLGKTDIKKAPQLGEAGYILSDYEAEMLDLFRSLSPEDQRDMYEMGLFKQSRKKDKKPRQ